MIRLRDLAVGEKAKIIGYCTGPSAYRKKLLIMGLLPGTQLQVIGVAPFGDPIQISLRGFLLCLRKQEANILQLEKIIP